MRGFRIMSKCRRQKLKKLVFRGILLGIILLFLFVTFIEEIFEVAPPLVPNAEKISRSLGQVQSYGNYKKLADCWAKKEMGLEILSVRGAPFKRGVAAAKLTGANAIRLEKALLQRVQHVIGNRFLLWLLRKIGYLLRHDLPDYFSLEVQQEVYGYTITLPASPFKQLGSPYFRGLNYQAAHDTGHQVMDRFLSLQGCTSFAAWGAASVNGHLIIGRNFDFEIGDIFDRFKQVQVVCPDDGIAFISVSWSGMSGVVSGVNRDLIAVTLNAAKSDHSRWKGTPVTMIARAILQRARTLAEAVAIIESNNSYISESFLLADGKTNQAIVVEKTPVVTIVRKPEFFKNAIVCANHFLAPALQNHRQHRLFVKEGSSLRRLERMRELLSRNLGKIEACTAAAILRDRKLKGDIDIGMGHTHSINSSIGSHSIIMDLSAQILWVSRGPHQTNQYLPISIKEIFAHCPEKSMHYQEQDHSCR